MLEWGRLRYSLRGNKLQETWHAKILSEAIHHLRVCAAWGATSKGGQKSFLQDNMYRAGTTLNENGFHNEKG